MLRLCLVGLSIVLVACAGGATDATRDSHCFYPGDTVGQVKITETQTGKVDACFWVVMDHLSCGYKDAAVVSQRTTPACPKETTT